MWGNRFQGGKLLVKGKEVGKKRGGAKSTFSDLSSPVAMRLGTRYTSRNLLDRRSLSVHSRRNDHRIPGLLLDHITTIPPNRQSINWTSRRDLLSSNHASRNISPGNDIPIGHVYCWVCGVWSPRVPWPFTVPWKLEHGFTPGIWAAAPLNGDGREVDHNKEEDRD